MYELPIELPPDPPPCGETAADSGAAPMAERVEAATL
jgi:hypothetical protein